jgi:predicted phosphodiesterase
MDLKYSVTRLTDWTIEVRMKYKAGFNQKFLLCSDVHFDNPKCDRKLLFKHLGECKEANAGVFCFGDFYCLMNGKYDPRRKKTGVRDEYNKDNYFDLATEDAADQLQDYAQNLILFSDGNHETAVLKNIEINPLRRFVDRMNFRYKADNLHKGGYQGFVRFVFEHESGGNTKTINLFYHHGKFGGIVTKGVLGVGRHGLSAPDADIIYTGHTHDLWLVAQPRYRLKRSGEVKVENQYHVKGGTYKQEFEQTGGWAAEKIVMPKNLGGWWLDFSAEKNDININFQMAK